MISQPQHIKREIEKDGSLDSKQNKQIGQQCIKQIFIVWQEENNKEFKKSDQKPDQSVQAIDTAKSTTQVKTHGVVKPKKQARSYSCYWCN